MSTVLAAHIADVIRHEWAALGLADDTVDALAADLVDALRDITGIGDAAGPNETSHGDAEDGGHGSEDGTDAATSATAAPVPPLTDPAGDRTNLDNAAVMATLDGASANDQPVRARVVPLDVARQIQVAAFAELAEFDHALHELALTFLSTIPPVDRLELVRLMLSVAVLRATDEASYQPAGLWLAAGGAVWPEDPNRPADAVELYTRGDGQ